jgi:hypothetical protein
MRVERANVDAKERFAKERVASDARLSAALAESFTLALGRYRPQTGSGAEEARRRPADRSASSRSTERREERARQANSPESDAPNPNANPAATPDTAGCACSALASLMRGAEAGASVPVSAKPGAEARKTRRSVVAEGPHCIEVVDPRTGMRFVLSREGEVWLLAIQSQTPPNSADLDSLVATLRAQFSDRGLGPVDIVIA